MCVVVTFIGGDLLKEPKEVQEVGECYEMMLRQIGDRLGTAL